MKSYLIKKGEAIKLRKSGKSIRDIESTLRIPRSTLSNWLRNIELSSIQKRRLQKKWSRALIKARIKAREVHKAARQHQIEKIRIEAKEFVYGTTMDKILGELIFATFYLAEGAKTEGAIKVANSNPKILASLLTLFRYLYSPDENRIRCCLHLRQDQSEKKMKTFWSKTLNVPISQFTKTQFDKRSIKPSFKKYNGVCELYYGDTNLQRRITAIGEEFFQFINKL